MTVSRLANTPSSWDAVEEIVCTTKIVDTMANPAPAQRLARQQYSQQLKAQVVQECQSQSGASPWPALHWCTASAPTSCTADCVNTRAALVVQTKQFVPVTLDEVKAA